MLIIFLIMVLVAAILYGIISLIPEAPSPAEKLVKQQGHLTNKILGKPAGEITLPLELQEFTPFRIEGNYITDIFTQIHNKETLFSFLLHGRNYHTKWSLSNPLPVLRYASQTHFRCWLGKLPITLPNVEIFFRRVPQDVHPFCTQTVFSSGNTEWNQKFAFAGDPRFISFLSSELISWIEKNRLHIMISSGWMLLIEPREITAPNDEKTWQKLMEDMSAWTSLQDILIKTASK